MGASAAETREMWRLVGAALLLAFVCAGAALMTLRADAQPSAVVAAPAAAPTPAAAPAQSAPPADQIPDDPTLAPDPREKADDNVSFPVDI